MSNVCRKCGYKFVKRYPKKNAEPELNTDAMSNKKFKYTTNKALFYMCPKCGFTRGAKE